MKIQKVFSVLAILGVVAFQSCRKDGLFGDNAFVNSSLDLATQQNLLEINESEINDQIENGLQTAQTRTYPVRTWLNAKGTYPNTLIIDYGSAGVTGPNGHIRKGIITVQMSAPLNTTGAVRTVNHTNFYLDDIKIQGTVVLTNVGKNAMSQNVLSRLVTNRKLSFPSGKTIEWEGNQTLTQIEGSLTDKIIADDVWSILGSSTGVNRAGDSFTVTTVDALIYKANCPWLVQGKLSLSTNNSIYSIDYGEGFCNSLAVVTLPDGVTKEINLLRWW